MPMMMWPSQGKGTASFPGAARGWEEKQGEGLEKGPHRPGPSSIPLPLLGPSPGPRPRPPPPAALGSHPSQPLSCLSSVPPLLPTGTCGPRPEGQGLAPGAPSLVFAQLGPDPYLKFIQGVWSEGLQANPLLVLREGQQGGLLGQRQAGVGAVRAEGSPQPSSSPTAGLPGGLSKELLPSSPPASMPPHPVLPEGSLTPQC